MSVFEYETYWDTLKAKDAELDRLRAERDDWKDTAEDTGKICRLKDAEIERLKTKHDERYCAMLQAQGENERLKNAYETQMRKTDAAEAKIERLQAENRWLYDQLAAQREAYRELVSRRAQEGK